MMPARCGRCETLPDKVAGEGTLYLWFPLGHSSRKAQSELRRREWSFTITDDGCTIVGVTEDGLRGVLDAVCGALSQPEIDDTRALFKPGGGELTLSDFSRVRGLSQIILLNQSAWLVDMLREERLTALFQPIVHAGQPAQIYGYEGLIRGVDRDGGLISPWNVFEGARQADMLFQLDLAARGTVITEARAHNIRAKLFINFTPTAVYDPKYCLQSTVRAIDAAGIAHEDVVFEVIETDRAHDIAHLQGILNFYRSAGFKVALDDMGAGYSSLNLIHQLRPDLIKLDMELIRGVDADPYKALIAEKLLEIALELGVHTIAEGVQTPAELRWVQEHGATFAQGYLIAKPGAPPVTELSPAVYSA